VGTDRIHNLCACKNSLSCRLHHDKEPLSTTSLQATLLISHLTDANHTGDFDCSPIRTTQMKVFIASRVVQPSAAIEPGFQISRTSIQKRRPRICRQSASGRCTIIHPGLVQQEVRDQLYWPQAAAAVPSASRHKAEIRTTTQAG